MSKIKKICEDIGNAIGDATNMESLDTPVNKFASTGCTLLDLAIANRPNGGIPVGRATHVYGAESTCKTVLAMTALGANMRHGGLSFFADVESTFDNEWAKNFGLDCDDDAWRYGYYWEDDEIANQPETLERFFDEYLAKIIKDEDSKVQKVIAVDSLSALPSEAELDADMKKGTYGMTRAKQISTGLRKYWSSISKNNITLFMIDQARDDVASPYKKETVSGGRALKFYSSVRIHLKLGTKVTNANDKEIGIWVKFRIEKNKVSAPFKEGQFKILWNYGIDDIGSNLEFLKDSQSKGKSRKASRVEFGGKNLYVNQMIKHVEENNLEQELIDEVTKVWFELHAEDERKDRLWI